ncbi:MAG: DUF3047 domain-containing protein [Nitrospinota bacterium]
MGKKICAILFIYQTLKGSKVVLQIFIAAMGITLFTISPPSFAGNILLTSEGGPLSLLTDQSLEDWRPMTFPKVSRHTKYSLLNEEGRQVIRAESHQSASGIYKKYDLDPKVYSILSWCWKINRVIAKGDETRKEGDDYAARIYVTFKFDPAKASFWEMKKFQVIKLIYGEYPPKAAINYIWANRLTKGKAIANAYSDSAKMIAVESGAEKVGQWICEERNLYDDYKLLFGETPPSISGIAIMTDTDNTGEDAIAHYAGLILRSAESPPSSQSTIHR